MTEQADLRAQLEAALVADLLGPAGGPDEVVDERFVRDRYALGMLAPRSPGPAPEESDEGVLGGADGEDGSTEPAAAPQAASMLPSSFGLTFAVAAGTECLQITAAWGWYQRVTVDDEAYRDKIGKLHRVWQRTPVQAISGPIPLQEGRLPDWTPSLQQPEVRVQGLARLHGGQWLVTLFLVNGQERPKKLEDQAWLFQAELAVQAPDGAAIFQRRPLSGDALDPERQLMAMLYRRQVEFAVGHGVAVHADLAPGCTDRAVRLRTAVVPAFELPVTVDDAPVVPGLLLDMKALAEAPQADLTTALLPLVVAYEAWIRGLEVRLEPPEPDLTTHLAVAREAIARCRQNLGRLREGIALLAANPQAAAAFRFANRAMCLQRVHSLLAAAVRQALPGQPAPTLADYDLPANHTWRPFQLAFILINLPGLTDLRHPDRAQPLDPAQADPGAATADLLWFPTGGGKTEAYLGLTAYVLAIRRLQGEVGGRSGHAGVAVLMRYTLRLLTLQQFQRAAALLCACEVLRRQDAAQWGDEPFRIGLWVGRKTTPNSTEDAAEAVNQLRRGGPPGAGSPHQLTNCPWCGRPIAPGADIQVETYAQGRGRTLVYCGDPLGDCVFSRRGSPGEGLPVVVVDEEIYRLLPSLLIATVDKFAQMPWNGCTAMLFGQVNGRCPRHGYRSPDLKDTDAHHAHGDLPAVTTRPHAPLRPPDLIVQDELHLISGPLGTLVGLYETAVDRLASWEVDGRLVRPKVIASTATIRRADSQVHGIFLRRVNVFPPSGLDAADSFFAQQREPAPDQPGRRYLGLCATGVRHKTVLIRAYVALLAAAQRLFDQHGVSADPWMTLVGYFNALRELGGMRRVVDDTITTRLRHMERPGLAPRLISPFRVEELTSRKNATDIPLILDRLETRFEAPQRPPSRHQTRQTDSPRLPLDVLLATNMISVGVDVGRLGLMVVAGQPKTTGEYIQATSRVGRHFPGLVCTAYNWARPRDLSHYESFEHYHSTFYQYVEALSVTPFSPRALDRGLSAVLVSLVRLLGLDLNDNAGAGRMTVDNPHAQEASGRVAARAQHVAGQATEDLVRQTLASRRDAWAHQAALATGAAHLGYKERSDGHTIGLLKYPGGAPWQEFTCLNSLRDVEPSVNLLLDESLGQGALPCWTFEAPLVAPEGTDAEETP